jgi:hypothetical protein
MFLGHPDLLVRGPDPDPSTSSKNRKINLDPTVLRLLYDFLSLKNYLNVPSKSNKHKTKNNFWQLEGQ